MPLLLQKTATDLTIAALQQLSALVLSGNKRMSVRAGSVARLLLAVINATQSEFYSILQASHINSFLSTATDDGCIDAIGLLVNCTRMTGESNDSFKNRISKQVTILQASNELSIRMATLSVQGVQDCKMTRFTHGTGSFSVFLVTENSVVSESIIDQVTNEINKTVAYGTKFTVTAPDYVPIKIGIKLIFKNGVNGSDDIINNVKKAVTDYINSKTLGESIIINEIIQQVMGVSDSIYDMNFYSLNVNQKAALISNQDCRENERFITAYTPDAVTIS